MWQSWRRDLCLSGSGVSVIKPIGCIPDGETYARSMGVNVAHLRFFMVILSCILSGCVAAFAGPVSFVGIAVPHLIRWLFADTRPLVLIPGCFLGGSVFCMFSDWLARTVFAPTELSISHGNSCLRCAGRDFCDDAETSKEHLKHRAAEEKIP